MHLHLIYLAAATSTTAAKSSKSSGSYVPLIVIVGIFAVVYLFFIRPRQQRMRQQQTGSRQIGVGDEVMSAGGIYGRVVAIDGDEVEVEVAPGVVMTFLRRAVSARPARSNPTPPSEPADEPWTVDTGSSLPPVDPPPDEPPAGPTGRQD